MPRESVVEIPVGSGNRYRYAYDPSSKAMKYLGPVGSAPEISEAEFMVETISEPRWDIDMGDLTGPKLKKLLGAKRAKMRWHNKNKSGGNFGFDIMYGDSYNRKTDAELTGYYDPNRNLLSLRWGPAWESGTTIYKRGDPHSLVKNMDELKELLVKYKYQDREDIYRSVV